MKKILIKVLQSRCFWVEKDKVMQGSAHSGCIWTNTRNMTKILRKKQFQKEQVLLHFENNQPSAITKWLINKCVNNSNVL